MCLFQFWSPQCVFPVVGLLGHMAVLFPVFQGISALFSIVAVLVSIPTNSVRGKVTAICYGDMKTIHVTNIDILAKKIVCRLSLGGYIIVKSRVLTYSR